MTEISTLLLESKQTQAARLRDQASTGFLCHSYAGESRENVKIVDSTF